MKLTDQQLKLLLDYVDALIDEKIEDAFGRDSLYESVKTRELRQQLERKLGGGEP